MIQLLILYTIQLNYIFLICLGILMDGKENSVDKFSSWLAYTFYRLICVFLTAFFTGIIAGVYAFVVNKIEGIPYEYGVLNLPIGFYVILGIGSCIGIYFAIHEKRHDLSWLNDKGE